jgi:hypothetical protein
MLTNHEDTLDGLLANRLPSRHRMKRAILTSSLLVVGLVLASPGCKDVGVGDPCTPEQEYDTSFIGFDEKEVNVESKSFQCRTRVCLVNHFRGRVSCPYGQSVDGVPPVGADPTSCSVPGDPTTKIDGLTAPNTFRDPRKKAFVPAQCIDRTAANAVYCSCRCADINGDTPGDQAFCKCPDGFSCKPLVTSIGAGNEGLTGSYCIKDNTDYNRDTACNQGDCDPITNKCGG